MAIKRTDDNLARALHGIGDVYVTHDNDGVEVYPNYAEYEVDPVLGWGFLVNDECYSWADVIQYGYEDMQARKFNPDDLKRVTDEITAFIYGGGKFAAKQPVSGCLTGGSGRRTL